MDWREIPPFPAFGNVLSTQERQALCREQWPTWAQRKLDFTGLLYTPLDAPLSTSTGMLSSGTAQAWLELERVQPRSSAPFRYYGFYVGQITDGRLFQSDPQKKALGYARHRQERAPGFASTSSTSS